MTDPIYLDFNATSPVAPEVIEAMIPALREIFGNASSAHAFGRRARQAVERGREQVASLIGSEPDEVIFTGGGTESDNAAIEGVARAQQARRGGKPGGIVISCVEHAAVERACARLENGGWSVTRIAVDSAGRVDADRMLAAIDDETLLVSLMHAQNETGVLQPVAAVGERTRARGIPFHVDAAQSVGKLAVDVRAMNADLLTIAAHKFYGPKGVGALYLRRGTPFESFLVGAGHEGGRRAGTENVPAIVGFGAACGLARDELPGRSLRLAGLRDRLESALRDRMPDLTVHGVKADRLPNTASVAIPGIESYALLERCPEIAAGAGAACHSGMPHVSGVLRAMGLPDALALSTLRLTVGRPTTEEEVDRAAEILAAARSR